MNIQDLNIEQEVLPFFDYTLNDFARGELLELLETPLATENIIIQRHEILRGFDLNYSVLKEYSYSLSYLNEVHFFLQNYNFENIEKKRFRYQLNTSKQDKIDHQNKLTQVILLFHKLQSRHFSVLKIKEFPTEYSKSIIEINHFFESLRISYYALSIAKNKFSSSQVIELSTLLIQLRTNGDIATFWDNLFLFEAFLS